MDSRKMQIICDLMDELKEEMQYGKDDFDERLGRKKADLEVVKVEGDIPMEGEEMAMDGLDDESEEDKLKKRLMKMRA